MSTMLLRLVAAILCLTGLCLQSIAAERPNLSGRVVDEATKAPIADATVFIYTAGVRTGTNPYCPSCYADCGKLAQTDANGAFIIKSLDPELIFRILTVAEGYEPKFTSSVDPLKGAVSVELVQRDAASRQPDRVIRGRVLDPDGEPVVGATISPKGVAFNRRVDTTVIDADPIAISNEEGEFLVTIGEQALSIDAYVEKHPHLRPHREQMYGQAKSFTVAAIISARSLASRWEYDLAPGKENIIEMQEGVLVVGRAIDQNGDPVPGIEIGIVHEDRSMGRFLGDYTIGTRDNGRFELPNLPPNEDYFVYGKMSLLQDRGAIPIHSISKSEMQNGQIVNLRELTVQPAYVIRGRVALVDGAPIPPQTRILLSRQQAWDSQTVELGVDGSFEFRGVPDESVGLSVRIKGYRMCMSNPSLDLLNPWSIIGSIERNIDDLIVQLEPGEMDHEYYRSLQEESQRRRPHEAQPRDLRLRGIAMP
jgi:hypothetical protein